MLQTNDIPQDYDGLLEEYKQRETMLEKLQQKLYDCKRQLDNAVFLQNEYKQEIEALQNDKVKEQLKIEQKLAQIEENHNKDKSNLKERIIFLEQELAKLEEQIKQNAAVKTGTEDTEQINENQNKLYEKMDCLEEENEDLRFKNEEFIISLEEVRLENTDLREQLTAIKNDMNEIQEMLKSKREELLEKDNLVQTLTEELACVKVDLEMHKSMPLDQESQGNSLFAEVNDRRVYLENKIKSMKEHYLTMERERGFLLQKISHLQNEKMILSRDYKEAMEEQEKDEFIIRNAYEEKIDSMERLLKNMEEKLKEKKLSNTFEESIFEKLCKEKDKQIESLNDLLSTNSMKRLMLGNSLTEADKEKRRWKFEATQFKTTNDMLLDKLKDLGYDYIDGQFVSIKLIEKKIESVVEEKENVENVNVKSILKEPNLNKENEQVKTLKRLVFDESTIEPNVSTRVSTRRCNIIHCPPKKFISSKPE